MVFPKKNFVLAQNKKIATKALLRLRPGLNLMDPGGGEVLDDESEA